MVRNYYIKIMLTKEEKQLIRQKAERLGFSNLTAYLRWLVDVNHTINEQLQEIKYLLKKNG